jgi:hypothetical protein
MTSTFVIARSRQQADSDIDFRHCEERSDEAIQGRSTVRAVLDCRAAKWRLAMTAVDISDPWYKQLSARQVWIP